MRRNLNGLAIRRNVYDGPAIGRTTGDRLEARGEWPRDRRFDAPGMVMSDADLEHETLGRWPPRPSS
jgi:hypothetical protein|tara:strand:+ start:81 stop:281 length:201 start_codon:yes stop_codon:yes gene_type:complete